ncbi:MAG: PAS domain S-box protein, partial [Wenzhouxiangella sp.]
MSNIVLRAKLARLAADLGVLAMILGAVSLFGRLLGMGQINVILPSYMAALTIVLCGGALTLTARGSSPRYIRPGRALAMAAIALSLATFAIFVFLPIDWLHSLMMAPVTAMLVLFLAAAILFVQRPGAATQGQILALVGLTISVVALIGYLEGLAVLASSFPIRLLTALSLVIIAVGVLCARPDRGLMKIVTSATSAGRVARRLMLPLVLLPLLLNFLFHRMPEWAWQVTPEMNNVLFTFSSMVVIALLAWWQILTLYRSERRQRQFEERARQARGQYELVVQAVSDYAIFTIDPEGAIGSWNTGAERIMQYEPLEVIGQPFSLLFSPSDQATGLCQRLLEQARREGRVVYEGWELRRDGSSFFAHSILTRMNDLSGRLLGYTKVTRDITSQKQAEQEQTKLQSILNTVVDPLLVIDSDGLIETFNPAAERVFGYQASEVMNRNVSLLMPSPVREEHDGYLSRYRETREARVIGIGRDIHAQRKNGAVFPAELSVSEMWVQGRQKFTGIVRDISARKAAEEALQRSERRLNLALEAGNIGVWDMDVESEVVIATGPLFEPLMVPEDNTDDLTGWISQNHPDDRLAMREQFDQIVRGDGEVMEFEHRLRTRAGGWYWLFTRASVSRVDANGKALSMH